MLRNTKPFLLNHLRLAVRRKAEEVRFVSGQQPSIKVAGRLLPGGEVTTSAELVQALHEVCLSAAERQDSKKSSTTSYAITLPEVGAFACHFEVKGNTKALSLLRDPREAEFVNQGQRIKPPPLGEAAEPNEES